MNLSAAQLELRDSVGVRSDLSLRDRNSAQRSPDFRCQQMPATSVVEVSTRGQVASAQALAPSPSKLGDWPHHGVSDQPALLLDVIGNCFEINPLISENERNKAEIVALKAKLTAERAAGKANIAAKQSRVQNLKLELGKARSDCRAAILMMERQAAVVQTAVQHVDASTIRLPAVLWQLSRKMIQANRYTVPDIMVAWNVAKSVRGIALARAIILIALRAYVRTRVVRAWSLWRTMTGAVIKVHAFPSSSTSIAPRQLYRIFNRSLRRHCAGVFHKWHTATIVDASVQLLRRKQVAIPLRAVLNKATNRRLSIRFAVWRAAALEVMKLQETLLVEHVHILQGRLSALEAALYQVNFHSGDTSPRTGRSRGSWKAETYLERRSVIPQGVSTIDESDLHDRTSSEIPEQAETHPTTLGQNSRTANSAAAPENVLIPTYEDHASYNDTTIQEAHATDLPRRKETCRRPSIANPNSLQATINAPVGAAPVLQPGSSTKCGVEQGTSGDKYSDEEMEPNSVETNGTSALLSFARAQGNRGARRTRASKFSRVEAVPHQEHSEAPCCAAPDTMTEEKGGAPASAGFGKIKLSGGFKEYVRKLESKRAAASSSGANVHIGRRLCRRPGSARNAAVSWDAPSRWDQVAWTQEIIARSRFELTEPLTKSFRYGNNEGVRPSLSRPLSAPPRRTSQHNQRRCKPHQSARQQVSDGSALNVGLDTRPHSPSAGAALGIRVSSPYVAKASPTCVA